MRARIRPTAVICDVHVPDHDRLLWSNFLQWCKDERPSEVIINGDFLELESCSGHGGQVRPPMLMEDIEAGREALAQLIRAAKGARITYLEGNHEDRLGRKTANQAPEFSGALSIPELLDLKKLGIPWMPYGKVLMRGKLGITHGWWCTDGHARKHLQEMGCSVAYGHTHKPQMYTRGLANGSVHGAFGLPCMRVLDADWLKNKPSGWMQGFGVFYFHQDGCFSPYMVLVNRGTFVWNGNVYGK